MERVFGRCPSKEEVLGAITDMEAAGHVPTEFVIPISAWDYARLICGANLSWYYGLRAVPSDRYGDRFVIRSEVPA